MINLTSNHLSETASVEEPGIYSHVINFLFLILNFGSFLPQFLHIINTDMLAANQIMIGKCLELKYSWKRSSVQVQSKRNFLNVSHKLRKKNHKILLGHVYKKDKVFRHHYTCREMDLLELTYLTDLLLHTLKYFKKKSFETASKEIQSKRP